MLFNQYEDTVIESTYEHGSNQVPSVTQILKHINEDYIAHWANSLGFKGLGYRKELNKYAIEGTKVHNEIEEFLTNGLCMTDPVGKTMGFMSFIRWYKEKGYDSNILIEPLLLEKSYVGKYFCGTIDAVMNIDGNIHIVDYKTSSTIGYKYFMQLSAYKYLLSKVGIEVDKLTILQLDKYDIKYTEYTIDTKENSDLIDLLFSGFIYTLDSYNYINKFRDLDISSFKIR